MFVITNTKFPRPYDIIIIVLDNKTHIGCFAVHSGMDTAVMGTDLCHEAR